jgi:hypothetical protein
MWRGAERKGNIFGDTNRQREHVVKADKLELKEGAPPASSPMIAAGTENVEYEHTLLFAVHACQSMPYTDPSADASATMSMPFDVSDHATGDAMSP